MVVGFTVTVGTVIVRTVVPAGCVIVDTIVDVVGCKTVVVMVSAVAVTVAVISRV
jgi:hypothetical protein